eukprot:5896293-Prymnesium_polylepis.1
MQSAAVRAVPPRRAAASAVAEAAARAARRGLSAWMAETTSWRESVITNRLADGRRGRFDGRWPMLSPKA